MHFLRFLKQEAKEIKHKNNGGKDRQNITCYDEKLNLKWGVEGSERLRLRQNSWKFLSFWEWSDKHVPNKAFELFIPASQTFLVPRCRNPIQPFTHNSPLKVAYPRFRSNQIIHPRALIKGSGSSNVRVRSTVLMTPWKQKPRIHSRH